MVLQPMALATPVDNLLPEWQVDARSLGMEPMTSRYDTLSMGSAKSTRLMPEKDLHPIIADHRRPGHRQTETPAVRDTGRPGPGGPADRETGTPADRNTGMVYRQTGMVHRDGTPDGTGTLEDRKKFTELQVIARF